MRADGHNPVDPYEFVDWRSNGACRMKNRQVDFFCDDDNPELVAQAKNVCKRCDVREQCLEWAMGFPEEYGVWGGMTTKERVELARRVGRKCRTCKESFSPRSPSNVYCSHECVNQRNRDVYETAS